MIEWGSTGAGQGHWWCQGQFSWRGQQELSPPLEFVTHFSMGGMWIYWKWHIPCQGNIGWWDHNLPLMNAILNTVTVKIGRGEIFLSFHVKISAPRSIEQRSLRIMTMARRKNFSFHGMVIFWVSVVKGCFCWMITVPIRSIELHVEWYIKVRVCHKDTHSQNNFGYFKYILHFCSPMKGLITSFVRDWVKQMCLFRTQNRVRIDITKETTNFVYVEWWDLLKADRNVFLLCFFFKVLSKIPVSSK